jgi:hypothetical protein
MQPVAELTHDEEGHLLLIVRGETQPGETGMVTIEAWEHEGQALGVLVLHSTCPMWDTQRPAPCPLWGVCYMDVSYSDGFAAGAYLLSGQTDRAEEIARSWFTARLSPDGVLSS